MPRALRFLTNPALFLVMSLLFGGAILVSLFAGAISTGGNSSNSNSGAPQQMNEISNDALANLVGTGTPEAGATPDTSATPVIKHYTTAPPMTIDTSQKYVATISTSKGDITVELDPSVAPAAVNAFAFLAGDGYYDGSEFLQVATTNDGTPFTAQAGDPTDTGLGTPGFTVDQPTTDMPFDKGAVGYDNGQFYISLGDFPSLTGKYTIIGQVTSGLDVLSQLSLLNIHSGTTVGGDTVQSVTVAPANGG